MTYRLSTAAENDLVGIFLYGIETFGLEVAQCYRDQLAHAFDIIGDNPHIARERTEIRPPVRVYPCGSHMIVYVTDGAGSLILRIRHQKEDWERNPL